MHVFARKRRTSSSAKNEKPEKKSTQGAHELFLQYEGFLAPAPAPRTTTSASRITTAHASKPSQSSNIKSPEEIIRSSIRQNKPHISASSISGAVSDYSSQTIRPISSLQEKASVRCPLGYEQARPRPYEHFGNTEWPLRNNRDKDDAARPATARPATRSWLRRRISAARSLNRLPPPDAFTMGPNPPLYTHEQSCYRYSIYDDANLTALPTFPGSEKESLESFPLIEDKILRGAGARAAAAAQNELYESLRNMRLEEPKVTLDSESGVGIEVRDQGDVMSDTEIPVIRKDPLFALPAELMEQILSFLDHYSLTNAELVSHQWRDSASSRHVWRKVYHAECLRHGQKGAFSPARLPNRGKEQDQKDWKKMCRARTSLNSRWKNGQAAAIYLEGHTDSVYCVQFDEDKILTGSRDRTVRIWDARTYECVRILGVPSRAAGSRLPPLPADVQITDHGRRPIVKVFSPPTTVESSPDMSHIYHSGSILCLQYDDDLMITGSSDCTLLMWDAKADYRPIRRMRKHTAGVLDVCFDEKHVVSCSKDATVCLWDRQSGDFLRRLTGHRGPVNAVQMRGDLVVSASGDGIAKLWNLASGLCIKEFPSRDRGMACVEFSLDSRSILAGGNDQVIYQFDTSTGELVREMKGHEGLVRSLHLDSASGRVISGSYDHSVRAYDLSTGENIVNFTKWTSSWILSAKSDYRRIIATSQDSRAVIMDFGYQVPEIESLEE